MNLYLLLWIVDIKQKNWWSFLWKTIFIYDDDHNHVIMNYFMTPKWLAMIAIFAHCGVGGLYIILGGENAWHRAWLIISSNPSGPLLQRALLNPVKYIWSESFSSTPQWTSLHIAIAPHSLFGENQLWCSLLAGASSICGNTCVSSFLKHIALEPS